MELVADESVIVGKKQLLSHNISVSPKELEQLEMQKKAVAVQAIDNERENESIEQRRRFLDKREADLAVKEADSMSRQDKRSKELDEREYDITQSENRVKKH